jgi:cation diffusion facilitator family transporter
VTRAQLTRFAWLSVGAAIATIALKGAAWWITGSVGLLSDALESFVNLAAALLTLFALALAARPPDEEHAYGYSKAEYFSTGIEGMLIFIAAVLMIYAAIQRLIAPEPIERVGIGAAVSVAATAINFIVARILMSAATRHRSIALEADARHLMADVWTSIGVVAAVVVVALTGWWRADPLIALAVALHVIWTGSTLLHRASKGLLDHAMPADELAKLVAVLDGYDAMGVRYHALMTRQAAERSFVTVHILVPGEWTVQRGHDLLEEIETAMRAAVPHVCVLTHLEPVGDPLSYEDIELDRRDN